MKHTPYRVLAQRLYDTAQMRTQFPEWLCQELEAAADALMRVDDGVIVKPADTDECFCAANGIGNPSATCGDCPKDYAREANKAANALDYPVEEALADARMWVAAAGAMYPGARGWRPAMAVLVDEIDRLRDMQTEGGECAHDGADVHTKADTY